MAQVQRPIHPSPGHMAESAPWEDEPETVGVAGREDRGSNNPAFLELEKRTPEEIARLDRIRAEMEADMARRAAGLPNPNGEAEYEHRF